jgi:hypothetical protein
MSQLRDYQPETDIVLVGNCHVMRGEVFIIGGDPGVGKSRAALALAIAGALGTSWLGLPVHRKFRTMIIQTENGRYRLQQECAAQSHQCEDLDEWVRISEPPPFGLTLTNVEFMEDIRIAMAEFKPDVVILDPWNAAAKDDKQRDYSETFNALRNLLPTGADKPALGIVAHTRKPQPNEKRTGGTGLMHMLAGSYILTSVPRSVFIMVRATADETDDRVVWFNPKNNNGEHAPRTAWRRGAAGFEQVGDFDWEEFENPQTDKNTVKLGDLRELFENGAKAMELADAVKQLSLIAGVTEGHAYKELGGKGKFAAHIRKEGKSLTFSP